VRGRCFVGMVASDRVGWALCLSSCFLISLDEAVAHLLLRMLQCVRNLDQTSDVGTHTRTQKLRGLWPSTILDFGIRRPPRGLLCR
jgi:hypothetical protein